MAEANQRLCVVTGASRGIGRAIALALGGVGHVTIGTATTSAGAEAISSYLNAHGIRGAGKVLDVTDGSAVEAFVSELSAEHGSPLVLVNNAGVTRDNLLLRMKEAEWDEVLDTDLKSVYRMTKACLRGMTKARFGRIVNITSVVGVSGNPGQSNYAAAKAGMIGFTKSLAAEVAARNITVNAIAPGFIDTDMTRAMSAEQRDQLQRLIPSHRLGSPEDIAGAVRFLASARAGYITGITLHVNGGMYMTG